MKPGNSGAASERAATGRSARRSEGACARGGTNEDFFPDGTGADGIGAGGFDGAGIQGCPGGTS